MKIEKNTFVFYLSDEICVDLGDLSPNAWDGIKKNVRIILAAKQTDDIGLAYIAAFMLYLSELDMMSIPYNPKEDLFN